MDYAALVAAEALNRAGRAVTPADRVPGLYNVAGLASDVTIGQLWQLAQQHGVWNVPMPAASWTPTMILPR